MAKRGRKKIEIDKEGFEGLCELQCTKKEIAGFFHCSEDTIERWCKRTYIDSETGKGENFAVVFEKYSANGHISLRRMQFRLAEKSAAMAIWLGKQYLGQTDKVEIARNDNENEKDPLTKALDAFTEESVDDAYD